LAPEIIQSKPYSQAVDWYALGVLIYEMLAGYPPFYKEDHVELYQQILEGKYSFPPQINHSARDLIRKLLQPDLSKRYGNLKGGVEDIKNHKWFAGVNWEHVKNKLIIPPYIPRCRYDGDTSHFDQYPEDYEPYDIQKEEDIYADIFKVIYIIYIYMIKYLFLFYYLFIHIYIYISFSIFFFSIILLLLLLFIIFFFILIFILFNYILIYFIIIIIFYNLGFLNFRYSSLIIIKQ